MCPYTKLYPNSTNSWIRILTFKKNVQNWLERASNDPITKTLAKHSNLTKIQLETLLIDILAENLASKQLKYEEKAKLRQTKATISRGSFNRTLRQAKENVIQSIYTILLLGYFGVLENASLTPYLDLANKLKGYAEAYRDVLEGSEQAKEQLRVINMLREELKTMLEQLSRPWTSPNS